MKLTSRVLGVGSPVTLVLLACMVFLAGDLQASTLRCVFRDEEGKLLKNVEVRLTPAGTENHLFQKSNSKGETVFVDLKSGLYELRAQTGNRVPVKRKVQVAENQILDQVLMSEKAIDQVTKEIVDAIESEQFSKALPLLEKQIANYPEEASLHRNLALAHAGLQQEDKAMAEADTAAQLDPELRDSREAAERVLLRVRGQEALKNKNFVLAVDTFEKWVKLDPRNAQAYYGLALAYGHQQKYPQSLAAIDKALELAPDNESFKKVKQILQTNAGVK